ncbi:MAG: alkaline phosphatase D family protein [Rufibacter sp.]
MQTPDSAGRRDFFKKLGLVVASWSFSDSVSALAGNRRSFVPAKRAAVLADDFSTVNDRVWLGEKYWAIPMEDWRVKNGRVEFDGNLKNARVNLLTSVIKAGEGEVLVSAEMGLMNPKSAGKKHGSAGFLIGVQDEDDPENVKAACYFGKGFTASVSTKGTLFLAGQTKPLPPTFDYTAFTLTVTAKRQQGKTQLVLICKGKDGSTTELIHEVNKDIPGLVALVNNTDEKGGEPFWFRNFGVSGSKIQNQPQNSFGPILWAMHTLSMGTLRLTAQMPPLGEKDNQTVDLFFRNGNSWQKNSTQKIDSAARIALFEVKNWKDGQDMPYRLVYENQGKTYTYEGTVRKEPLDRPMRFGGLTCQEWAGFPYSPLVRNLEKHNPDILYFSGDQLYEGNGGYPIKRAPESEAILSYLGKWYMFGWAFKEVMRDRPTICTPDDHDVFQGNLWGSGGRQITNDEWRDLAGAKGGYVQTPKMVNVVGQTQCGNLPAPFHAEPLPGGIQPWYTEVLYGGVSFAIISDRMFKSAPGQLRTENGNDRLDFVTHPAKEGELEAPHLEFLGKRQMEFLEHWIKDWQGADMKVLLSQTLFANVGTHHGPRKQFLYGDMDSGGWPKQKKDEVIRLLRKAFAFHINGDQHLPFLVQYSLDGARDSGWTFCTPAVSTGFPRWGQPDLMKAPFTDRPVHNLPNTGLYKDVFGSHNYVYAVGNPVDKPTDNNRYQRAQEKASGFGVVTFNTKERTIKMEAFRFLADKDKPGPGNQFPGWPLTISQTDNDGRKPTALLPKLEINKPNQLVQVLNEKTGELVNILRVKGNSYVPGVYQDGSYTLVIGEGKNRKELKGLKPGAKGVLKVSV